MMKCPFCGKRFPLTEEGHSDLSLHMVNEKVKWKDDFSEVEGCFKCKPMFMFAEVLARVIMNHQLERVKKDATTRLLTSLR